MATRGGWDEILDVNNTNCQFSDDVGITATVIVLAGHPDHGGDPKQPICCMVGTLH